MEVSVSKEAEFNATEYLTVEEVLAKYSGMVYRLAYARTMNKYDAEDITQEVFMKYIQHQYELAEEEYRKAWLIRVTINASKSLLTSAWNRKRVSIVHLFYFEDLSVKEISSLLGRKEATVKSHLYRAREILKKNLREEDFDV